MARTDLLKKLFISYQKHDDVAFRAADGTGSKSNESKKQVARTIAEFLNGQGGTLLIGVSNSGIVKGIQPDLNRVNRNNTDGFELEFREILQNHLSPIPQGTVQVSFETLPEGTIAMVEVFPDPGITYCENVVYIRTGGRKTELKGRDLVEWSNRRRGGTN